MDSGLITQVRKTFRSIRDREDELMSSIKQFGRDDFFELLRTFGGTVWSPRTQPPPQVLRAFNRWLERGNGIAVYRNDDLSHPMGGHLVFFSYGSPEAQFEDEPPLRCPDGLMPEVTGGINWRYGLLGTYRGEAL